MCILTFDHYLTSRSHDLRSESNLGLMGSTIDFSISGLCTGLCFTQNHCITALKIRSFVKLNSQHLLDILRRRLHCRVDLFILHMIRLVSYPWRGLGRARGTCFVGPSGNIFYDFFWERLGQLLPKFPKTIGNTIVLRRFSCSWHRVIPEITPHVRTCKSFLYLRHKFSRSFNLPHYAVCLRGC